VGELGIALLQAAKFLAVHAVHHKIKDYERGELLRVFEVSEGFQSVGDTNGGIAAHLENFSQRAASIFVVLYDEDRSGLRDEITISIHSKLFYILQTQRRQ